MQTKQTPAVLNFTANELQAMVEALIKGACVADVANLQPEVLEGMYALAYNLYTAGNYKDSETMFKSLCIYKHNEKRFWIGLAGSLQAQEKYREAVDAYSMAGLSTSLKDPEPFLHAANCYIKMGDKENAIVALECLQDVGDDANPEHATFKATGRELLHMLMK